MNVSRREKSSMMNKIVKKISAVAIAAAMTLSTGVAAQAATLRVYFREWSQNSTDDTYEGTPNVTTFGTKPLLTVSGIEKGDTYKKALNKAAEESGGDFVFNWNIEYPQYLSSIDIEGTNWGILGGNTNPTYDSTGKMTSATWVGTAWSWYEGSDINLKNIASYPKTTLGETLVPVTTVNNDNEIISMVLSYDETRFYWENK